MSYRCAFGRPPAVATEAMVATSEPLATRAGLRMLERGGNAVAALDRPRFRVEGKLVRLEQGLWKAEDDVRTAGLEPVLETETRLFGGGQAILLEGGALVGGSDPRKHGYAAGF